MMSGSVVVEWCVECFGILWLYIMLKEIIRMLNLKEKKSSTACPNPKSEDERSAYQTDSVIN